MSNTRNNMPKNKMTKHISGNLYYEDTQDATFLTVKNPVTDVTHSISLSRVSVEDIESFANFFRKETYGNTKKEESETKVIKQIIVTTNFSAFHLWPEAPDWCDYLKNKHRHLFYVEIIKSVNHSNRDIEFISLKKEVDDYIYTQFKDYIFTYSCEHIAKILLSEFKAVQVKVMEDNENGAIVTAKE